MSSEIESFGYDQSPGTTADIVRFLDTVAFRSPKSQAGQDEFDVTADWAHDCGFDAVEKALRDNWVRMICMEGVQATNTHCVWSDAIGDSGEGYIITIWYKDKDQTYVKRVQVALKEFLSINAVNFWENMKMDVPQFVISRKLDASRWEVWKGEEHVTTQEPEIYVPVFARKNDKKEREKVYRGTA